MSRNWRMYLTDMVACCQKVARYTDGFTQEQFLADPMRYDAVIRNIELIGEASRNVPDTIRSQLPEIAWRSIVGMRNVLIHAYFGIDDDFVWDIVVDKAPALEKVLLDFLSQAEPGNEDA